MFIKKIQFFLLLQNYLAENSGLPSCFEVMKYKKFEKEKFLKKKKKIT